MMGEVADWRRARRAGSLRLAARRRYCCFGWMLQSRDFAVSDVHHQLAVDHKIYLNRPCGEQQLITFPPQSLASCGELRFSWLKMDPVDRCNCEELIENPYFDVYRDENEKSKQWLDGQNQKRQQLLSQLPGNNGSPAPDPRKQVRQQRYDHLPTI